jgi:hypothetical protein
MKKPPHIRDGMAAAVPGALHLVQAFIGGRQNPTQEHQTGRSSDIAFLGQGNVTDQMQISAGRVR